MVLGVVPIERFVPSGYPSVIEPSAAVVSVVVVPSAPTTVRVIPAAVDSVRYVVVRPSAVVAVTCMDVGVAAYSTWRACSRLNPVSDISRDFEAFQPALALSS